jgi:predicted N-acetyltransferase YhbS
MEIRQAKMADLVSITEVEKVCFPPREAASKESFEKRLKVFSGSFLVVCENEEIIGFINGCVTDSRVIYDEMFSNTALHKPDGDYQAIFGLAVITEHRGRGIAQKLMKEFIDNTRRNGKKGLILTCQEHLLDFYSAFGYKSLGVSSSKHGGAVWYDMILEF